MRLDRNTNGDGRQKYGVVSVRKLAAAKDTHSPQGLAEIEHAVHVLETAGILDWGGTPETEFFLMRLKDKYAGGALVQYALNAYPDDPEYARDVMDLSKRAGSNHPLCKKPD